MTLLDGDHFPFWEARHTYWGKGGGGHESGEDDKETEFSKGNKIKHTT